MADIYSSRGYPSDMSIDFGITYFLDSGSLDAGALSKLATTGL